MIRLKTFYAAFIGFGIGVVLVLVGKQCTDNGNYKLSSESHQYFRYFFREKDYREDTSSQYLSSNAYDATADVDKMLEYTRQQIKSQLNNYNFSNSGVNSLEDLVMESNGQPIRNVIISTWRSGTTFLGDLLNAVPGTFYHFEPLVQFGNIQIRGPPQSPSALRILKSMLMCDFNGLQEYFEYAREFPQQFQHNSRLWEPFCKYKKELCYDGDFTGKMCKLFPFQTMKIVKLRLRLIEDILLDKTLNVKVVLLIRDPRGILQSRQHRDFCLTAPDCWRPDLLCADMVSDYVAASRLVKQFPNQLLVQRYEELALKPNATTLTLYKFFGLAVTPEVEEFVRQHTSVEVQGLSSTYKVSKNMPFKWKTALHFNYVDQVQDLCSEAMSLWGYTKARNASHMANPDFFPLVPYVIQL